MKIFNICNLKNNNNNNNNNKKTTLFSLNKILIDNN